GRNLVISNLGDSRAVLCTRDSNNELIAKQLTVDLKPNLPAEKERILSRRGRVLPMQEEPNVHRVWLPDQDCPGLAMARAFGDFCLKDYGLISTPEVTYRRLTDNDEFVVLASDGIWDVLSNSDVIKIVASARKRSMAAKMLIDEAHRAWRYKFPCAKIDDCVVVCLFFKRQRPLLTKSISEVTHLSLNYKELPANAHGKMDDGLETVLNCDVNDDADKGAAADQPINRQRRRRPSRKIHLLQE
ncbi:Protein phosphatase 2C family protein, partial [Perilla frutescens var. frutescens]